MTLQASDQSAAREQARKYAARIGSHHRWYGQVSEPVERIRARWEAEIPRLRANIRAAVTAIMAEPAR